MSVEKPSYPNLKKNSNSKINPINDLTLKTPKLNTYPIKVHHQINKVQKNTHRTTKNNNQNTHERPQTTPPQCKKQNNAKLKRMLKIHETTITPIKNLNTQGKQNITTNHIHQQTQTIKTRLNTPRTSTESKNLPPTKTKKRSIY